MAADVSDKIISKTAYDAAKRGAAQVMATRDLVGICHHLGYMVPDVVQQLDDCQPRFEAVIERYGQENGRLPGA